MRKYLIAFIVIVFSCILYAKDYYVSPMNQKGKEINIDYLGCHVVTEVASDTLDNAFVGAGLVYGVMLSQAGTAENAVAVYDSSCTIAAQSTQITPGLEFDASTSDMITFDPPLQVAKGVSLKIVSGAANSEDITVLYRKKSDN